MKVETNSVSSTPAISGTDKGTEAKVNNRVLGDQSVVQGKTVSAETPAAGTGAPEIPAPGETTSVGGPNFGGGSVVDIQQLLMWIATMAAEYIKQQSELNKTRQKAVEAGYQASIDAAQKNYDKNMTQAIVGIVGASVSLAGAGIAGLKLGSAGKELKNLTKGPVTSQTGVDVKTAVSPETTRLKIDQLTATGQTWNAASGSLSQGIQSIGGAVSAGQELDAKQQEALSQLISRTTETITSNEGSTRQIIDKFANELMALLKNFYASTAR